MVSFALRPKTNGASSTNIVGRRRHFIGWCSYGGPHEPSNTIVWRMRKWCYVAHGKMAFGGSVAHGRSIGVDVTFVGVYTSCTHPYCFALSLLLRRCCCRYSRSVTIYVNQRVALFFYFILCLDARRVGHWRRRIFSFFYVCLFIFLLSVPTPPHAAKQH